ncbi:MAG: secondary thiamine-phosphate synthase enzyme YjbQ [Planctomycetes bacterium]|nr:secondary thiamine-phosphate synthase enzyme YjbQ [Planctomycetota bacterium]
MSEPRRVLTIETGGRGFTDITASVAKVARGSDLEHGVCHVFCRHTSASLILGENADPRVRRDLEAFMQRLVPDGDALFTHRDEGPDDMPAHVRAAITASSLSIPFWQGELELGTWQGIYLWEHRVRPHRRQVVVALTRLG